MAKSPKGSRKTTPIDHSTDTKKEQTPVVNGQSEFDHQKIDDVIHSRLRLAIMAVLASVKEADFTFLRDKVNATDGNLSVHLKKLEEASYISVQKLFVDRKPQTIYALTGEGHNAFEAYINHLESLIKR